MIRLLILPELMTMQILKENWLEANLKFVKELKKHQELNKEIKVSFKMMKTSQIQRTI